MNDSIFSRNSFNISLLVIDLLIGGGLLLGAIIAIAIVSLYRRRKDGYYEGETKDGKPNGRGILHFGTDDPIEKIECNTFKDGKLNGVAKIFTRENNVSNVSEYNFQNDYILKNINKKPNVAYLVINQAIDGPGEVGTKLGYQDKYGVFQTYALANGIHSLNTFIKKIKKNNNIDVIKIGLLNHGEEKGEIQDTHGSDLRNILERLCAEFGSTKKIYIVNNACFGADKFDDDPEERSLNDIINSVSAKYGNKIILAQHKDKDTPHMVLKTYDNKTKLYGVKHISLKYSLVFEI